MAVLALTAGCDRALVVKTPLGPSENFSKDDAVFVDGTAAGHVKKVVAEGDKRVAVLTITEDSAKQKMWDGVVRIIDDRNSHLLKTKGSVPSCPHRFVDAAAGTPILISFPLSQPAILP